MTVSKRSLAYRWYHEWELRGGKRPPVMNLCHFVRVLVVWGPLRFLAAPKYMDGWLLKCPPFVWAVVALLGSVLVIEWEWGTAFKLLACLVGGVLIFGLAILIDSKHERWEETFRLFRDYRTARRSRICPLVEVE